MSERGSGGRDGGTDDLVERVAALVSRTLDLPPDQEPLGADTPLYGSGLGLDSLDALRLVAALEEEFDITIDDAELTEPTFARLGGIVCLVQRLRKPGSTP